MIKLWLFVEGRDEKRFIDGVFGSLLINKYGKYEFIEYPGLNLEQRMTLVRGFEAKGQNYIFLSDTDPYDCLLKKKEEIIRQIKAKKKPQISIVNFEIESWYLGGLCEEKCKQLRIPFVPDVEVINKEEFKKYAIKSGHSIKELKLIIIEKYDINIALQRSKSFSYFMRNYLNKRVLL